MRTTQPIESPEVLFIGHVPVHEHIYSNGFICLSILYDGNSRVTQSGRPH
jgi:ubiquitin-protein ligase